jgi:hypothetical protein
MLVPQHERFKKTQSWMWIWKSVGLIVDTCHDWRIKRMCEFDYDDFGVIAMTDGRIYYSKGAPVVNTDCGTKGESHAATLATMQRIANNARDAGRR